jgi:hypothetical protein
MILGEQKFVSISGLNESREGIPRSGGNPLGSTPPPESMVYLARVVANISKRMGFSRTPFARQKSPLRQWRWKDSKR